jgi:hypothetical protein
LRFNRGQTGQACQYWRKSPAGTVDYTKERFGRYQANPPILIQLPFIAPGLNMPRIGQNGRNFEYFGEDPFLTGVMTVH